MTGGSLFSGIEMLGYGIMLGGLVTEIRWQVEIDDWCRDYLSGRYPDAKQYKDAHDVGAHNLEPVDVIWGGFPCQPFSIAGSRRGTEDNRHLWPEMLRVVAELRPSLVLAENVLGLTTMAKSRSGVRVESRTCVRSEEADIFRGIYSCEEDMLFNAILEDLEGIGYWTLPLVIPAGACGAPHLRDRVFVVAYSAKSRGRGLPIQPGKPRESNADIDRTGESDVADTGVAGLSGSEFRGSTPECADGVLADGERDDQRTGLRAREQGTERRERSHDLDVPSSWTEWEWLECEDDGKLRRIPPGLRGVCRMDHGVSDKVQRIKALGNGVDLRVGYCIGTIIREWMVSHTKENTMVKLSPMIKNLTPGLAEAGKIKIGIKGQVRKTKDGKGEYQLPQKIDHFVVTSLVRDESGNFGRDETIHQMLGDKPTRIPIMLLFDEIHRNFQSRYACYEGKKLWCSGDGEQANRAGCDEPVSCPCERSDTATPAKNRCKLNGIMSVIIRGTERFGCVWKFRTTSYNSIQSITSSLYLIQQITGGPLAGLDLDMVLLPKAVADPDGNQLTIYVVGIEYVGGMEKLRDAGLHLATSAAAHRKLLTEAMVHAADDAITLELSEAIDDVVEEHYPENDPNYVEPKPPTIDLGDGSTVDTRTGEVTEAEPEDEPDGISDTDTKPESEPTPKQANAKPATAKQDMPMLF